jgi:hypothetical protein
MPPKGTPKPPFDLKIFLTKVNGEGTNGDGSSASCGCRWADPDVRQAARMRVLA